MALEIKNAGFSYPNGYTALENINLTIDSGELVAIVGQNGAGKTTCVKLMNGLHKPTSGDVIVDGINTKEKTTAAIARMVGYVFQNPDEQIFNNTVKAEIEYMLRYYKFSEEEIKSRLDYVVELTGIANYLDSNPYEIPFPIRKFVTIASVIATKPRHIILDEPTAGQDLRGDRILADIVKRLQADGITVVTITHDMEFAIANFPRIIAMAHKNVIADGTAKDIFWNEKVVSDSKIRKPVMGELAKALAMDGQILTIDEMVSQL